MSRVAVRFWRWPALLAWPRSLRISALRSRLSQRQNRRNPFGREAEGRLAASLARLQPAKGDAPHSLLAIRPFCPYARPIPVFGGGVFRSTDDGDSWTPVNNGLECGNIWSLAISETIFAGTAGYGDGIYRSTDNGDSWTLANTGLTSTDVGALAINDSNGHIFAGTHSIMGQGGGMFRSTDNGDTWTEQNNHFTALDVNSLAINSLGHIFAGAAGGVFRSTNDGERWTDASSGLLPPGGNVWTLAIDSGGFVFAGTAGGGVFRSVQATVRTIPPRPDRTPWPRPTP